MRGRGSSIGFCRRNFTLLGVLLVALILGSCDSLERVPVGPDIQGLEGSSGALQGGSSRERGFYPLEIGNQWTYEGEFSIEFTGEPPSVILTREVRTIIGTEERFGREYVLEEQVATEDDGTVDHTYWIRYRQDRAGLYEADIAVTEPPVNGPLTAGGYPTRVESRRSRLAGLWSEISAGIDLEHREAYRSAMHELLQKLECMEAAAGGSNRFHHDLQGPPGGVLPEELIRLRYPLHPGQEWNIREDPFVLSATVIGHAVLDLPPGKMNGYEISLDTDVLGPNDFGLYWYGRQGFLQKYVHVEAEITDPSGNPIDTLIIEETLSLESLDLVRSGRF